MDKNKENSNMEFKDMFGNVLGVGNIIVYPYGFDKSKHLCLAIIKGFTKETMQISAYRHSSQWTKEFDIIRTNVYNPQRAIKLTNYNRIGSIPNEIIQLLRSELNG